MFKILTLLLWILFGLSESAQGQSILWTSFDQLEDSLRVQRKPLMVFIHTDWCKYCKIQKNVTFENTELVELLNKNYYCLRLDAEGTDEISFLGRTYDFKTSGGYHQLAEQIGRQNNQLIFPTTVLLSRNFQVIKKIQGLQNAEDLINYYLNPE